MDSSTGTSAGGGTSDDTAKQARCATAAAGCAAPCPAPTTSPSSCATPSTAVFVDKAEELIGSGSVTSVASLSDIRTLINSHESDSAKRTAMVTSFEDMKCPTSFAQREEYFKYKSPTDEWMILGKRLACLCAATAKASSYDEAKRQCPIPFCLLPCDDRFGNRCSDWSDFGSKVKTVMDAMTPLANAGSLSKVAANSGPSCTPQEQELQGTPACAASPAVIFPRVAQFTSRFHTVAVHKSKESCAEFALASTASKRLYSAHQEVRDDEYMCLADAGRFGNGPPTCGCASAGKVTRCDDDYTKIEIQRALSDIRFDIGADEYCKFKIGDVTNYVGAMTAAHHEQVKERISCEQNREKLIFMKADHVGTPAHLKYDAALFYMSKCPKGYKCPKMVVSEFAPPAQLHGADFDCAPKSEFGGTKSGEKNMYCP